MSGLGSKLQTNSWICCVHLCVYQYFIFKFWVCQGLAEGWAGTLKVAFMVCACVCMEYAGWPKGRHRLQFHSNLCLPPRMKPYRIMNTLRLLLPQHRQLACHNTVTQAGREKKGERKSQLDLSKPHFLSSAGDWIHPIFSLWNNNNYTMDTTLIPSLFVPLNLVVCSWNQSILSRFCSSLCVNPHSFPLSQPLALSL